MKRFDRRSLLKAAAGLPLLSTLLPSAARANGAPAPKRIVFWFQPNGMTHTHYHVLPGSTENSWGYDPTGDLHALLPLVPYHARTIHFDSDERAAGKVRDDEKRPFGLTDLAGTTGPDVNHPLDADGHPTRELTIGHSSPTSLLTGRFPSQSAPDTTVWQARGESIDVYLGNRLSRAGTIPSVQLGVSAAAAGYHLSYSGDGVALPIVDDPRQSFQTLFTGIPNMPGVDPAQAALVKKMKRRSSVFEAAYARFGEVRGGLVTPDQVRLDQHFDAYKSIHDRLTQLPVVTSTACHAPDAPASNLNVYDPLGLPTRGKLMIDQMVLAMACDVSRVFNMSWTYAATNQVFTFLPGFSDVSVNSAPAADGHHPLSHDSYDGSFQVTTPDNQAAYDKKRRIERWYAEQLAYFLGQLDSIKEADGSSLLDNTIVVTLNELSHSGAHNNANLPVRLYGNAGGAFSTGRYLALPQTPLNSLYVSLANAVGVPTTTFGETAFDYSYIGDSTMWKWSTPQHVTTGALAQL